MRLLVVLLASLVCGFIVPSAIADKPPAPPGQGECSHGNTGKDCKPDPSTNGKDCDPHGNNGGVNEDHCVATTTTTTTTNETTTNQTTTTNKTTTTNGTTTTNSTTTDRTVPTTNSTPIETVTPLPSPKCDDGSNPPCVKPDAAPTAKVKGKVKIKSGSAVKGELPFTGLSLWIVVALGSVMLLTGLTIRLRSRYARN